MIDGLNWQEIATGVAILGVYSGAVITAVGRMVDTQVGRVLERVNAHAHEEEAVMRRVDATLERVDAGLGRLTSRVDVLEARGESVPNAATISHLAVQIATMSGQLSAMDARVSGELKAVDARVAALDRIIKTQEEITTRQEKYLMQKEA